MKLVPDAGPQRTLTVATLVNTIGNGVYMTAGVLYFTRVVGLPAVQVGLGLSVAGIVSLLVGLPAGHLADRRGARGAYTFALVLAGLAMAAFVLVDHLWSFMIVACLSAAAHASLPPTRAPLIRRYGGDRPQRFRAYLRSVTNLGTSVGALVAGWAVHVDTELAYVLLIAGNAASFAACAVIVRRLPPTPPEPVTESGPRWVALRDRPYALLSALDGIMNIQFLTLTVALPLWLVNATSAPRWLVGVAFAINTMLVVLFQVRVGRDVDTPRSGGFSIRRAGFTFFVSCALFSLAAGTTPLVAAVLLAGGVVIHTIGELWHAAGQFELSYGLAPAHAQGQYVGVFSMGNGVAESIGPVLLTVLCIEWGRPGWFVVGAMFAVTGLTLPFVVRWAERERTPATAA